jgi:hypothetical protein
MAWRMNAPTTISTTSVDRDAQSLMSMCRERRWNLLQQFACLEIALKHRLDNPPKTFGAKMRAWIRLNPTAKSLERLISARNLIAHAFVSCVRVNSIAYVQWEIADGTNELNCAKFDKQTLKTWTDELDRLVKKAIAAAGTDC